MKTRMAHSMLTEKSVTQLSPCRVTSHTKNRKHKSKTGDAFLRNPLILLIPSWWAEGYKTKLANPHECLVLKNAVQFVPPNIPPPKSCCLLGNLAEGSCLSTLTYGFICAGICGFIHTIESKTRHYAWSLIVSRH